MRVSAGGPPVGIVTFLFTDIEGSTHRWETDADSMRKALAAHDEVLRSTVEEHGGWLFKHTGDGVCAAFASPMSAVDAAVDAQRALGLPVRMGIATGEAEFRDRDYFGTVLNRAARVMAAFTQVTTAITHLRDVLGDQTYESLARKGETMTTTAMAIYAYDQIDQARAELEAVSK